MIKTEGTFLSCDKVNNIAYYVYTPEKEVIPKAILQISHGMCEYIPRYEEFAKFLTDNGVVVCGNDHLGHGKSAASEEDLGWFGKKDGWLRMIDDLDEMRKIMRKKYRSLPYILLGHSMGSFIARAYLTRYGTDNGIDGAIICGTSGGDKKVKVGIFLTGLIAKIKGGRYRSKLISGLSFKGYNSHFKEPHEKAWLSKDREITDKYIKDTHCKFTFTVQGYNDMFRVLSDVSSDEWANKVPKNLSIFLISGEDDPVGNYGEGVRSVYTKLEDADINDVKIKLYEKDRHEILNETDRDVVYKDVFEFINGVCEGVIASRMGTSL